MILARSPEISIGSDDEYVVVSSSDAVNREFPAEDLSAAVDAEFRALIPDWHGAFDGLAHVTPDALDRLEADLITLRGAF